MKFTSLLCTLMLVAAAGCSSSGTKTASEPSVSNRADYVSNAQKQLKDWDDKAAKLNAEKAARLRADIADTRAELQSVIGASDASWQSKRAGVDNRMSRIQNDYNQARSE